MSKVNMTCIYGLSDFSNCCHLLCCSQDKLLTCRRTNYLAVLVECIFGDGAVRIEKLVVVFTV